MNIRLRITVLFVVLVASIIMLFSLSVYYLFEQFREQEFYQRLRDKAITTVRLLEDVGGITQELLHSIDRNNLTSLPEEEITIYGAQNQVIYDSGKQPYPIGLAALAQVRAGKELQLREGNHEIFCVRYVDKHQKTLVLVAYAADLYGFSNLERLRYILLAGWVSSLFLVGIAGWIFANDTLRPVAEINEQVNNISARNIHERLKIGREKDELAQLAGTFNDLLNRLDEAFQSQKSFVSHASHELRTPLTILMGEMEVTLLQQRSPEQYQTAIRGTLEEAKKMRDLINSLLELARLNSETVQTNFKPQRVDDLLWQARGYLVQKGLDYRVNIVLDELPENESDWVVNCDDSLLRMAFLNLMQNGCKYSPKQEVTVSLKSNNGKLHLFFADQGVGIAPEDLPHVFEPFYRSQRVNGVKGHGVGLALTRRIVQLHRGEIEINSELGKGTIIEIKLSSVKNTFQQI